MKRFKLNTRFEVIIELVQEFYKISASRFEEKMKVEEYYKNLCEVILATTIFYQEHMAEVCTLAKLNDKEIDEILNEAAIDMKHSVKKLVKINKKKEQEKKMINGYP